LGLASVGAHTVEVETKNLALSREEMWGDLAYKEVLQAV
jgi:hypothetical protein